MVARKMAGDTCCNFKSSLLVPATSFQTALPQAVLPALFPAVQALRLLPLQRCPAAPLLLPPSAPPPAWPPPPLPALAGSNRRAAACTREAPGSAAGQDDGMLERSIVPMYCSH